MALQLQVKLFTNNRYHTWNRRNRIYKTGMYHQ